MVNAVVSDHGPCTVITVTGDVDVTSVVVLRDAVYEQFRAGRFLVVLDLSGLTFVDSPGLGAIVGFLRVARANGGDLGLAGVSPRIRRLFTITSLDDVFRLDEDVPQACAALQARTEARSVGCARS